MNNRLVVARVVSDATGRPTPHDGRWVKDWNPHTKAGTLALTSTDNVSEARVFTLDQCFAEWKTQSLVQPIRPWDGQPNRPLAGINLFIEPIK